MKVLFIGNSHTFVHYVPLRVKAYFEAKGEKIDVTMLTHPGMGLDWHLQQSQTYFNLIYGDYDAVVLQHNAHPFPGRDSLINAGKEMAKLVPDKTKIYLYMTWSEKKNPEGQQIMSQSYRDLGKEIGAIVCPVGDVWKQVRENYPDELYFEDGEHSSVFGASLSATVIAKTLLNEEIDVQDCYDTAKVIEKTDFDERLIDLVIRDGEYAMCPLKDIKEITETL